MATKEKISLDLLGDIIKGLKLDDFAYVEPDALVVIKSMIKNLPGREGLEQFSTNPYNIENIQKDIGKIMRLIELYGKRDLEYKTRYRAKTQLDPRYKVLDNNTQKAANRVATGLIRISAIFDEDEKYGEISSEFIKCAIKAYIGELTKQEMAKTIVSVFDKIDLNKKSDKTIEIKKQLADVWNNMVKTSENINHVIYNDRPVKVDWMVNPADPSKMIATINTEEGTLQVFRNAAGELFLEPINIQPLEINYKGKIVKVNWVKDPLDPSNLIATIDVPEGVFKVRKDSTGKYSLEPFKTKNPEEELDKIKPELRLLMSGLPINKTQLESIKNLIQLIKSKKQISKDPKEYSPWEYRKRVRPQEDQSLKPIKQNAPSWLDRMRERIKGIDRTRNRAPLGSQVAFFNLNKHLVKTAIEGESQVKRIINLFLTQDFKRLKQLIDFEDLDQLEKYVDEMIVSAPEVEHEEIQQVETKPEETKPVPKPMTEQFRDTYFIPEEVKKDPAQAKMMLLQLLEKKKKISEEDDKKFIEAESVLFDVLSNSNDPKIEEFRKKLQYDVLITGMGVGGSKAETKDLPIKKNFYNEDLYYPFVQRLLDFVDTPIKVVKAPEEVPVETKAVETGAPQELQKTKEEVETPIKPEPVVQPAAQPVEQAVPRSLLTFKINKLLYDIHIGKIKVENFPNEIKEREKLIRELQEKIPASTKWNKKEYIKNINGMKAEIKAMEEIQKNNLTFEKDVTESQIFNLSRHIKYS